MRVTTAFKHLLRLPGIHVRTVTLEPTRLVVEVALRRRRLLENEITHFRDLGEKVAAEP